MVPEPPKAPASPDPTFLQVALNDHGGTFRLPPRARCSRSRSKHGLREHRHPCPVSQLAIDCLAVQSRRVLPVEFALARRQLMVSRIAVPRILHLMDPIAERQ